MRTAHSQAGFPCTSQVGLLKFLASMNDESGDVDTAGLSASVLRLGEGTRQRPGQALWAPLQPLICRLSTAYLH